MTEQEIRNAALAAILAILAVGLLGEAFAVATAPSRPVDCHGDIDLAIQMAWMGEVCQ